MTDTEASRPELAERYRALWEESAPLVREGRAELDPTAVRRGEDRRRGVTLLARPDDELGARLAAVGAELGAGEPGVVPTPAGDLHLTVLSLFTATVDFPRYLAHFGTYQQAVEDALEEAQPFDVELRGVTLSPGAVLVQGFPADDTLHRVRERLRAAMQARGRGGDLDQRYRLETAHLTLARFGAPLVDPPAFVERVGARREVELGTLHVDRLELVLGDWYLSAERVTEIEGYLLGAE